MLCAPMIIDHLNHLNGKISFLHDFLHLYIAYLGGVGALTLRPQMSQGMPCRPG